jgi:cytochrome P450
MAEFHTPFFRSFLVNQPDLIKLVLAQRPADFPKSELIRESLESLLGNSVFVTNGEVWKRQRRIIDRHLTAVGFATSFRRWLQQARLR